MAYKTTYHRDGSITYWSVYEQQIQRVRWIPDRELAACSPAERDRIIRHFFRNNTQEAP